MSSPPSGQQFHLVAGDREAWVSSTGATLRAYEVAGEPRLDGFGVDQPSTGGRGQLLMPWPNRLRDGSYRWGGQQYQLPLTEPARGNAIHGLVRWQPWSAIHADGSGVTLRYDLDPCEGYPFRVRMEAAYHLDEAAGLSVGLSATNLSDTSCPFGAGAHPYLRLNHKTIDTLWLRLPASTMYVCDDRQIPEGTKPVAGTEFDFGDWRQVGSTVLDTAYTDLSAGEDGLVTVEVRSSEGDQVAVWMDAAFDHVMVFTGDTLAEPTRRRAGLAIEPMTCAPNAWQSDPSGVELSPGTTFTGRFGIR
jgi:aldose 1-epimerase